MAATQLQSWFPRVLRPGYSWAIQASLWIPIAGALIASKVRPQLMPAFIGAFALASLFQALVLFSALLSSRARSVFVVADVPFAEHRRRLWAQAGGSFVFFVLAGLQAVIMRSWFAR